MAKAYFGLDQDGEVEVRIHDLNGVPVLQQSRHYTPGLWLMSLDLGGLPKGVYLCRVRIRFDTGQDLNLPVSKFFRL